MVTYVALLMLLQLGLAPAVATFCSALLFVPWVLKSFMRPWVSRVGRFRQMLHLIEALLFACLLLLAFSFKQGPLAVFFALLMVSLLCAWHELAARMYYEQMLSPSVQRLLTVPKHVCSQAAVIFTYGALIFLVGTLQVYFRQIRYSWAMGCYVAAGLFLFFAFLHLLTLASPALSPMENEVEKRKATATWHSPTGSAWRGLGFAQGTVGVIAFSLGIAMGRLLIRRHTLHRLFWPMALCVVLSPFVYLGMTIYPPHSLWMLCCCTMTAQLLFGLGISICRLPVSAISGTRYRNNINMLQIPLVSAAMIVPMALSGWMVEQLGYNSYFLVNALSAPVCLLGIFLLWKETPVTSFRM